jgi:hypothetical protein
LLSEIAPIAVTQDLVLASFNEREEILHRLFLCTAGKLLWDIFSSPTKKNCFAVLPVT